MNESSQKPQWAMTAYSHRRNLEASMEISPHSSPSQGVTGSCCYIAVLSGHCRGLLAEGMNSLTFPPTP